MTFYERERNRKTLGLQEIQTGTQIPLKDAVVRGERVSRVATVIDPDTIKIEHHIFGAPGVQSAGWPLTREYTGDQVNSARFWRQNKNDDPTTDKRVIWKLTSKK